MKVIDILTEGATGEATERVLKSILGHSTWSAAQKIAFKESVDLCADAIEKMLLKGQDITTAAATKEAWFAIQPRLQGTGWATRDFVQEIFTVAKAEAEERVAKKAAALKSKEQPKTAAEKTIAEQAAFGTTRKIMNTGLGAFITADIGVDVYEYYTNQQEFLRRTKLPKTDKDYMSPEVAMKADVQQKVILIQKIAAATVLPATVAGLTKAISLIASTPFKWLSGILTYVSPNMWGSIKKMWAVKRPKGMSDAEYAKLIELTAVKWENLSSIAKGSILSLWLAVLNSNERYAGAANWKIKNSDGTDSGYTVGTVPGGQPDGLSPKEMISFFAINYGFGHDVTPWMFEAFQALWNFVTPEFANYSSQKQEIQKAAGKPVTPNTVAKPPKVKEYDGVTLQGWD